VRPRLTVDDVMRVADVRLMNVGQAMEAMTFRQYVEQCLTLDRLEGRASEPTALPEHRSIMLRRRQ
jgi:hypothetical protein